MDTIFNLQQVFNGLQLGAIYALIALGYTLVYGVARMINFAHGDFVMVGAYAAWSASFLLGTQVRGGGAGLLILAAMAAGGIAAAAADRFAYRPLRHRPKLSALVTAIGVSLLLEHGASALPFIGPTPRTFPEVLAPRSFPVGPAQASIHLLVDLGVAAALMAALGLLIHRTALGRAMRAVAQDREAAQLMGIDVERIIPWTFVLGGAFAGAAGVLSGAAYPRIQPFMGLLPGLKAFVAAVLGGIGSVPGAVLGALVLGLTETFANAWNSAAGEGAAFLLLILVLLARPQGLLGERAGERP